MNFTYFFSVEMRDTLGALIATNRKRPEYLVYILREIKNITDDYRLRVRLLRSLRDLQDTQPPRNPLVSQSGKVDHKNNL